MSLFYVYVTPIEDVKTAIIVKDDQVLAVLDCDGMTNTEILRSYSSFLSEIADSGKVITNHQRVIRRYHTSGYPFYYELKEFSKTRRQHFIDLAYQWVDEQDAKLKTGELSK